MNEPGQVQSTKVEGKSSHILKNFKFSTNSGFQKSGLGQENIIDIIYLFKVDHPPCTVD